MCSQERKITNQSLNELRFGKINTILKQLKNDSGAYPQQMFIAQVSYLLYIISGVGQKLVQEAENI